MNVVRVIGIGVACVDYLLQVPDLREVPRGCKLTAFKRQGGGMAATAMVAAARLGGQAELWTVLGQDDHGDVILAGLEAEGVDVSRVVRLPDHDSGFNFVLVDGQTGERVFLLPDIEWGRGNASLDVVVDWTRVDAADALLVDGHWNSLALPALKRAREVGIPTCADMNRVAGNESLLPWIDYLVVSRHVAEEVAGEVGPDTLTTLGEFGARLVAITLGAQGVLYLTDGEISQHLAFDIEVTDTTGAGDVFHGALVYGVARGWGARQLMLFSSSVAALKCMRLGGRTGIPSLAQVRDFLTERMPREDLGWLIDEARH